MALPENSTMTAPAGQIANVTTTEPVTLCLLVTAKTPAPQSLSPQSPQSPLYITPISYARAMEISDPRGVTGDTGDTGDSATVFRSVAKPHTQLSHAEHPVVARAARHYATLRATAKPEQCFKQCSASAACDPGMGFRSPTALPLRPVAQRHLHRDQKNQKSGHNDV